MRNEIENIDSLINVSMIPVNSLTADDDFIRIWVPMVIDSDEEEEVLESEEDEEESDFDDCNESTDDDER